MNAPYGAADGLVRVYPAASPHGAGLVWAHGGGFAAGDLDMPEADAVATALAARGTTVVSVDYRLVAEGCRYPAPSDDLLAAWSWTLDAADRLHIDPARLALGGASAGGNLVAGAVLRLIDAAAAPLPALVVLAYPTLLAIQPAPDAALRAALDAHPEADRFGQEPVRAMYEGFLGGPVGEAPLPAVPGRAEPADVAHYPPTLFVNGDIDELRVGAEVFAATLSRAGRAVEAIVEPGTQHGHLNRPEQPAFAASIERIARSLAAPPVSDRKLTP